MISTLNFVTNIGYSAGSSDRLIRVPILMHRDSRGCVWVSEKIPSWQEVNKARVCLVLSRRCDNAMLTGGKPGY